MNNGHMSHPIRSLSTHGSLRTTMPLNLPLMRNNILRQDLDAVIHYLNGDDPILTQSRHVRAFEEQWSQWLGVKYSVFVNSGSSANLVSMALLRLRYPEGGEVIVPPLTWVSDIAAVIQNGFTPVFADIDLRTLGIDPYQVLEKISSRTRAVFVTHAQGFDALTDELIAELERRAIPLIEDVCESHGAKHNGRKLGSIGWMSNFSFYYAHHMSTIEGGMICTNDPEVYQQARMMRSHGMVREADSPDVRNAYQARHPDLNPDFIFAFPSYNVRNTEIGGILGLSQLKRIDWIVKRRNENLEQFLSRIDRSAFRVDFKTVGCSNYAFNLILNEPDAVLTDRLMGKMREEKIEFRRGSAGGGNHLRQPYLRGVIPTDEYKKYPRVDHVHFHGFYIGNFPDLDHATIDRLCEILNSCVHR
jgi:CDP-6-deoxy-D-xylo-4-hexulose-3-dehydrase